MAEDKTKTITIIDTNVFLGTGDEVFYKLENRDFVIPLTVYQELEKYRTNQDGRGYAARTVIRRLEDLRIANPSLNMSRDGVPVGDPRNNNTVRVEVNHVDQSILTQDLRDESSPDRRILAVAKNLEKSEGRHVELITNDAPLRFLASVFEDLDTRPYEPKQDEKFTGRLFIDLDNDPWAVEHNLEIGAIEDEEYDELVSHLGLIDVPYHAMIYVKQGQFDEWVMKNGDRYEEFDAKTWPAVGPVRPRNREQAVAARWLNDEDVQIVSLGGVAGAGKSLLAISYGLDAVEHGEFSKVTVFRSMYAVGRQEQGFLKGDAEDKMRPWAQAVWDDVKKYDKLKRVRKSGKSDTAAAKAVRSIPDDDRKLTTPEGKVLPAIEARYGGKITVEPITYLRGRTLEDQLVIVDDAQSLDRSILLDVISRLGDGSKIVFTFDMDQQDNPYLSSGTSIESLIQRLKGDKRFAHIDFEHSERSELAQLASKLLSELA